MNMAAGIEVPPALREPLPSSLEGIAGKSSGGVWLVGGCSFMSYLSSTSAILMF